MVVEIKKDNIKLLTVNMDNQNIHLNESYTITDPVCMQEIINLIREEGKKLNLFYKRNDESWIREWKAHNMLYNAGLYKDRTAHTDLNEDESWFRRLGYWFLSLFYRY
jgi:hypothetical protein